MNVLCDLPPAVARYRRLQRCIPGVDGLYQTVRAIVEMTAPPSGRIMVVGAGGGRELELLSTLGDSISFIAVDKSPEMLSLAREMAEGLKINDRVTFIIGTPEDVPEGRTCEVATSLLVMHQIPDDGSKLAYLRHIRARMDLGSTFILADVCLENKSEFNTMRPVFLAHARSIGLTEDEAAIDVRVVPTLSTVSEQRTRTLLLEAGFGGATPFFRSLWYAGWWSQAI